MFDVLRRKTFPESVLKMLIFFALFFPFFTSDYDSPYSPTFIFVNAIAVVFMFGVVFHKGVQWKQKNIFGYGLLLLLIGFNVYAFEANRIQLFWYEGQLNMSIPFLFFLTLLFLKKDALAEEETVIRFLLETVVVSNAFGLIFYFYGAAGISLMNGDFGFMYGDPTHYTYEKLYSWIYNHKSQYAFMLVLFTALIVTYRHYFKNKWTYFASLGVMSICLFISHTYTSMVAATLIFAGQFADFLKSKIRVFKLRYLFILVPIAAVMLFLLYMIAKERNLLTLGYRTLIWEGGWYYIQENPYGIGVQSGYTTIPTRESWISVHNCHNVFLNLMLQFSIKAGRYGTWMIAWVALWAFIRNRSFTTLGILAALFIPMMMDWCVRPTEWGIVLLVIYFIFFSPLRNSKQL